MPENDSRRDSGRPWFGPKRLGWGLRPQTWQGWGVLLALLAAILLVVAVVHPG